ncbi:MAG TPA: autotransporter domain-containing protein [Devosiaceae bacterium]|nr:autotransporter domain-containing protein [Devosiaceae bacterium]
MFTAETAIGAAMAYEIEGQDGSFEIFSRAVWLHNWADTSSRSVVTLTGGGSAFAVASSEVGRDRLELGAGLSWSPAASTSFSLNYSGRFLGGQTEHIARAGLNVSL